MITFKQFITEEDDAFSGLELAGDVMSPKGKTVYAVITSHVTPPQRFYDGKGQLPKDAIFVAPNIWYADSALDPASGKKREAAAYITDKDIGLKLLRYDIYNTKGQATMSPLMTSQEYMDAENMYSKVMNTIHDFFEARSG